MVNYSDIASENFKNGYNCAQSVLLAFAKDLNIPPAFALKLASSFGGGMGRLREVCGAVSAMFMIAGLLKGYTEPDNDEVKGAHYELIQSLAKDFQTKYGTIICRELLGLKEGADNPTPSKRTTKYYINRPCEDFVRYASEIIENRLF